MKRLRFDRRGLSARLYIIFLTFCVSILLLTAVVEFFSLRNQARSGTKTTLRETAQNISAAYSSDAYMSTLRAAVNSGGIVVQTMMEDGDILVSMTDISYYISWPEIELGIDEILAELDASEGYFYIEKTDTENMTWVVYGQLVASWDGKREILLLANDITEEQELIRSEMIPFLKSAVIVLIAAIFISWFAARMFLKPIREITERAKLLSGGDYSVTFPKGKYTETDTLSETLDQAVEEMAAYEQMRRDMIANVSHDMRTPLTVIKAYAEMIKNISGDNPEKREAHLDIIISQADKLSDFVNDTLFLSKLQAGSVELNLSTFDLSETVQSYAEVLQVTDEGRHRFDTDLEKNSLVHADLSRIGQIITNLVNNSLKYGGDTITLRVKRLKNKIRMEIMDNGNGIPEEQYRYVWTRYYRINGNAKDSAGAGVGLSIVKEIADLHGLAYGIETPEGGGVDFWFDFPAI